MTQLYNAEARGGVALWNDQERTAEEMADWRRARDAAGHGVLVARGVGVVWGGAFLGYGALGPFRPHDGYAATTEHSIYVAPAARRRGVGRALLRALEAEARRAGRRVMVGGLEAENAASLALHFSEGFVETARMPDVGRKFGRWLTLVLLQKILDAAPPRTANAPERQTE